MAASPDKTWADLKTQGRVRYFQIANAACRKAWALKWLLYGSIVRSCKDPREIEAKVHPYFPDAWAKPSRWYFDYVLEEKRVIARAWMQGKPLSVSPTLLDHLLSWSNPNKEYR